MGQIRTAVRYLAVFLCSFIIFTVIPVLTAEAVQQEMDVPSIREELPAERKTEDAEKADAGSEADKSEINVQSTKQGSTEPEWKKQKSTDLQNTGQEAADPEKEALYRVLSQDAALQDFSAETPEAVYDPRTTGAVTAVRLQRGNSCWAFSSLGAGEASLLSKGAVPQMTDLSEAQLVHFFYHPVTDPLGNTAGDGNYNISGQSEFAVGSNTIFSTFALADWVGAAEESLMPFASYSEDDSYPDTYAYADTAHLQNAYWINFKDTDAVTVVKQMIKKYGGAAVNLYFGTAYYNSSTAAYYAPLDPSRGNNHSVTVVGWDDTYSRENFKAGCQPQEDGAWIVKNSYGTSWGQDGYFYLSYEDSAVNTQNTNSNRARAYIFDFEPAGTYDYNYQYDGSSGAYNATSDDAAAKIESGASIANVFCAGAPGNDAEVLKAVSFALYDTACTYQIQIYKNLTDLSDPHSGTPQLSEPLEGGTSYAGYYTIPFGQEIVLRKGETFSVVITLQKENGGRIGYFVDKTYTNGNWIKFVNQTEPGQSFRLTDDGWEDLSGYGMTARIKAFTTGGARVITAMSVLPDTKMQQKENGFELTLEPGETYQTVYSFYPVDLVPQGLVYQSTDPQVAWVDENGMVHAVTAGTAQITASLADGSGIAAAFSVTVREKEVISIRISAVKLTLKKGESVLLSAVTEPKRLTEGELVWTSSDASVVSVDHAGGLDALKTGSAQITVSPAAYPAIRASCEVTVTDKTEENRKNQAAKQKKNSGAIQPSGADKKQGTQQNSTENHAENQTGNQTENGTKIQRTKPPQTGDMGADMLLFWVLVFLVAAVLKRALNRQLQKAILTGKSYCRTNQDMLQFKLYELIKIRFSESDSCPVSRRRKHEKKENRYRTGT